MGNLNIEFKSPNFNPEPLSVSKNPKPPTTLTPAILFCARVPFAILALLAVLRVVLKMSPGLREFKPITELNKQAIPMEATIPLGNVVKLENGPILWAVLGAFVFMWLSYTPLRSRRELVWPVGLLMIVMIVVSIYKPLISGRQPIAVIAVLTLVICGCTIAAMIHLPGTHTPPKQDSRGGGLWLTLFLLSIIGPVAVGRALLGGKPAIAVSKLTEENFAEPTGIFMVYLVGASLGFFVWAIWQLLPPFRGRSLVFPLIMFIVAGVGGLGILPTIAKELLGI